MAGTLRVERHARGCLHHCASVPPVAAGTAGKAAGMSIQAFVPRKRGSGAGGSGETAPRCGLFGGSGRTLSSTNVNNPANAWNVNVNNGNVNNNDKTNTNYVWPVRGGE